MLGRNEECIKIAVLSLIILFIFPCYRCVNEIVSWLDCLSSQAVFLQSFPAVYGELLKLFTVREVATFVRETLGSLSTVSQADCPLEAVKLHCIAKTVESQLYTNPGKHMLTEDEDEDG